MNEVKIGGAFERGTEMQTVKRGSEDMTLCRGSLSFVVKRGGQDVTMWVDVECIGEQAFTLADIPANIGVTITGELRRAAWKDDNGKWQSRHFIYYRSHEMVAGYMEQPAPPDDGDIPF